MAWSPLDVPQSDAHAAIQLRQVARQRVFVLIASVAVGLAIAFSLLRPVRKLPRPPAAVLPASARMLLQPFRKDTVDISVPPQTDRSYEVGMQAGSTLVYAWSTDRAADILACDFADHYPTRAAESHSAFVAQSSGWYRWHWKNVNAHPVTVHLKLRGYYEPGALPYDR